jgi:hypothetical protein
LQYIISATSSQDTVIKELSKERYFSKLNFCNAEAEAPEENGFKGYFFDHSRSLLGTP